MEPLFTFPEIEIVSMSYATTDQLNAALTAAALSPAVTPTEQQIFAALHNADSRVNLSVRAGGYPLPTAPYSTSLSNAATAIALCNLLLDLSKNPGSIPTVNSEYQAASSYLDEVAKKKINPAS